ncbi:MAG TPA: hypothetical protein ENK46_06395 [Flavobacteriia bacterium]|nr:hypothetical protein [Flavobacteriia bacterium]
MSIILIIICSIHNTNAQNDSSSNNLDLFNRYSKWGFSLTPILYNKASITRNFGNITLVNKSMPSFQFGIKRRFYGDKQWSFNIGANLTLIPLSNLSFKLKKEDVFNSFNGFEDSFKEYNNLYLSIPLNFEFKRQLTLKTYFNFNTGINIYYLTRSDYQLSVVLSSEELNEDREIFALFVETQEKQFQASINLSVGIYFIFKKYMLQTNIVYNKTFKNLLVGEYQFGNLLVSEPTRGNYIVSGDFIGLSTTIYFKKRTKKIKRIKRKEK